MANEIKDLLDDITNDVNRSYDPETSNVTFDQGAFREKLCSQRHSLCNAG